MATCNRCYEKITWKQSKKGKWYAVNTDNNFHSNTCKGIKDENSVADPLLSCVNQTIITADKLLQKEKVNDAIKYIDGLNKRLPNFELELVVKEKGVDSADLSFPAT